MSSEARRRLVCRCLGVASPRIYAAVRDGRLASVFDVTKAVRAGAGCGLCHPEIEEILADVRGDPVDVAVSNENRLVCRQETSALVEGALIGQIAPRLAPLGVRIDGVAVDGLSVRVRLVGPASDLAMQLVTEQFHRLVCADLEIEVG